MEREHVEVRRPPALQLRFPINTNPIPQTPKTRHMHLNPTPTVIYSTLAVCITTTIILYRASAKPASTEGDADQSGPPIWRIQVKGLYGGGDREAIQPWQY